MKIIGKITALLFVLIGALWSLPSDIRAQDGNQAALVVRFNDDHTETACVEFEEPQISGFDLLQRSGFNFEIEARGMGAIVCSIEQNGCPASDCWCQCSGGDDCIYWSYWHQINGDWQYSQAGSTIYQIKPGAVDGWSWGPGASNLAYAPPDLTFEDVCQVPATDTASPTATSTPEITPTPIIVNLPETETPDVGPTKAISTNPPTLTATPTAQFTGTAFANATPANTIPPTVAPTKAAATSPPATISPTETQAVVQEIDIIETSILLPGDADQVNEQESLPAISPTKQVETPTNEPLAVAAAPTESAAQELDSITVVQTKNFLSRPEPAEALSKGGIPDEVTEPLTVIGSGVIPNREVGEEPLSKNNNGELSGSTLEEWFPYLAFLIIIGGLMTLLAIVSFNRRNKKI